MARLVAFLRGINLGGRRVKMDELRAQFEALGLEEVATFLASGNVVFDDPGTDPAALESRIEDHLAGALGYPVRTFLRPLAELERLLGEEALDGAEEDGFTPHAIFLRAEADGEVEAALAGLETPEDRFHVLDRQVLWLRRGGLTETPISTRDLEAALGGPEHTMRNLNTVRRIVAKFEG